MNTVWTDLLGVDFRQTYVNAGGIQTRVIEAGTGGTPLIFLHGTGGHAETYARNLAVHARRCKTYAIDMIGHGFTDGPDLTYDMPVFVDHLKQFVDTIGAKKVSLSGESLGAMVAAWFAILHPQRVEKLVLNTGMLMLKDEASKRQLVELRERSKKAAGELTRDAVRARLNWLMYEPETSVTEELVEVRYQIYSRPGRAQLSGKIAATVINSVLDESWSREWLDAEHMRGIRCPTLVLWTRHNPALPVELAADGMSRIADARMVVLEHSAHWPQWEEAAEFNRVHTEFLFDR